MHIRHVVLTLMVGVSIVLTAAVASADGTANTIYVTAASASTAAEPSSAASANNTYLLATGKYSHYISGFGTDDRLVLPSGQEPTVFNNSWSDNSVTVQWAFSGFIIKVVLSGLTNDSSLNSVADFNTAFGAGTITVATNKPGDCDNNCSVTIAEVQSAINMFLGLTTLPLCVDTNGDNKASIDEVQKVINGFLGV